MIPLHSSPGDAHNTDDCITLLSLANSCAVSAWWGFASAADRQRLQGLLQRGIRSGLCYPETPNLTELAESVDDTLFQRIMHNLYHVLHHLLPERGELVYNIRPRHHDRQLSIISGQLRNQNFITARFTLVQSAVLRSHVVCLSVRL